MAVFFVRGLIFGALANSIVPMLYSNTVNFMISSQNGMSITAPISCRIFFIGIVSLNAVGNAMCSTSAVDKEISVGFPNDGTFSVLCYESYSRACRHWIFGVCCIETTSKVCVYKHLQTFIKVRFTC